MSPSLCGAPENRGSSDAASSKESKLQRKEPFTLQMLTEHLWYARDLLRSEYLFLSTKSPKVKSGEALSSDGDQGQGPGDFLRDHRGARANPIFHHAMPSVTSGSASRNASSRG